MIKKNKTIQKIRMEKLPAMKEGIEKLINEFGSENIFWGFNKYFTAVKAKKKLEQEYRVKRVELMKLERELEGAKK